MSFVPSRGRGSLVALETETSCYPGSLPSAVPDQSASGKSHRERSWRHLSCEARSVASDLGCRTMSFCRCLDIPRHQRQMAGLEDHVPCGPWDTAPCDKVYVAETRRFVEAYYTIEKPCGASKTEREGGRERGKDIKQRRVTLPGVFTSSTDKKESCRYSEEICTLHRKMKYCF